MRGWLFCVRVYEVCVATDCIAIHHTPSAAACEHLNSQQASCIEFAFGAYHIAFFHRYHVFSPHFGFISTAFVCCGPFFRTQLTFRSLDRVRLPCANAVSARSPSQSATIAIMTGRISPTFVFVRSRAEFP